MYFATDDNNTGYYPIFIDMDRNFYESCLYTVGLCKDEPPQTFKDVSDLFEALKAKELNGGMEEGEYTHYTDTIDFIKGECLIYPLVPVEDAKKAYETIKQICIDCNITPDTYYTEEDAGLLREVNEKTMHKLIKKIIKAYNGSAPEWLTRYKYEDVTLLATFNEVIETVFDDMEG